MFKLDFGYIYKDKDPESKDSGIRIMVAYSKQSPKREHWFYGAGIINRKFNVGYIGGVPGGTGLEKGKYDLTNRLIGIYYQPDYKLCLGTLDIEIPRGVDPNYGKPS